MRNDIASQIKEIERRIDKGEKWLNDNFEVGEESWEKSFDLFCSLIRERAKLLLIGMEYHY